MEYPLHSTMSKLVSWAKQAHWNYSLHIEVESRSIVLLLKSKVQRAGLVIVFKSYEYHTYADLRIGAHRGWPRCERILLLNAR